MSVSLGTKSGCCRPTRSPVFWVAAPPKPPAILRYPGPVAPRAWGPGYGRERERERDERDRAQDIESERDERDRATNIH